MKELIDNIRMILIIELIGICIKLAPKNDEGKEFVIHVYSYLTSANEKSNIKS